MANHKSAAKRARQSKRRFVINSRTRNEVRTIEKKLRKAITEKNSDLAQNFLVALSSKVSKAAQKGVLHMNTASRKISRLSKAVSGLAK